MFEPYEKAGQEGGVGPVRLTVALPPDLSELIRKAASAEQLKLVLELVSTALNQVGFADAARVNLSRALCQLDQL